MGKLAKTKDIYSALHSNEYIARHTFKYLLRQCWPQLNEQSRIVYVDSFEVYIPRRDGDITDPPDYPQRSHGLQARLWRIVGDIFKRNKWWHRGMELGFNPTVQGERKDTVRLKGFAGRYGGEEFSIYCGYYAESDTLFIRK